jgi:hypothetical protein
VLSNRLSSIRLSSSRLVSNRVELSKRVLCRVTLEYSSDTTSRSALCRQDSSKLRKRNPRSLSRETLRIAWICGKATR